MVVDEESSIYARRQKFTRLSEVAGRATENEDVVRADEELKARCAKGLRAFRQRLVKSVAGWLAIAEHDDDSDATGLELDEDMALLRATTRRRSKRHLAWGELPDPEPTGGGDGANDRPFSPGYVASPCQIIMPYSMWKARWDLVLLALTLYSAFTVPIRVCFEADAEGAVWLFEASISLFFLADIVLAFNTAFWDGGQWVDHRPRIAERYLWGRLWLDAPASIPVEALELLASGNPSLQASERMLLWLRLLRLGRLLRLLRPLRVAHYSRLVEDALSFNPAALQVLTLLHLLGKVLLVAHVLGCLWFFQTELAAPDEPTWVSTYDGGSAADGPVARQYLYSIYWALTTISTVGYGDITPVSNSEMILTCLVQFAGTCVLGRRAVWLF